MFQHYPPAWHAQAISYSVLGDCAIASRGANEAGQWKKKAYECCRTLTGDSYNTVKEQVIWITCVSNDSSQIWIEMSRLMHQ
jgi:hypothetical protein